MSSLLPLFRLLLMMFARWVNRHQLEVIDYLQEENRLLKERLGGRRIHFADNERRRLARKAYVLGRKYCVNWKHWSHRTPCCDGTGNWWHQSGTTANGVDPAAYAS